MVGRRRRPTLRGCLLLLPFGFTAGHGEQLPAAGAGAAAQLALGRFFLRGRLLAALAFLALFASPVQTLPAQTDLAISGIDAEDLDLDLIADLDDILGTLNLVIGQLRDVQQSFQSRLQLDEDTEVGQLRDLALLDLAGLVPAGDVAFPRIVIHLLEAQSNALALLIDIEDDAGDVIALVDDLARMGHLAYPAHVADVQKTVDAFFNLDERSIVREVAHHATDDHARRITLGHLVPGIGLNLF